MRILDDTVTSVDLSRWPFVLTTQNGLTMRALTLIIATGATPKKLGYLVKISTGVTEFLPVLNAMEDFLRVSIYALLEGEMALLRSNTVGLTCAKNYRLVRSNRMRAFPHNQEKLPGYPNVEKPVYNKRVIKVLGNEEGVTGLEIEDTETRKKQTIKTDGLFLAIGQSPNTELFKGQPNYYLVAI